MQTHSLARPSLTPTPLRFPPPAPHSPSSPSPSPSFPLIPLSLPLFSSTGAARRVQAHPLRTNTAALPHPPPFVLLPLIPPHPSPPPPSFPSTSSQFNGGSALGAGALAGQAFFNTNTAAATSMITWLLLDHSFRNQPIGPIGLSVGAVIGLVVITPGAGACLRSVGVPGFRLIMVLSVSVWWSFQSQCNGVSSLGVVALSALT